MRITRKTLFKIAEDTVAQRVRASRNVLGAYLTGSLVKEIDPVFGGTADIDLVFVHEYQAPAAREILRLTEDVHLDIAHHSRDVFNPTRELRTDPHLGLEIYGCQILYDPRHFLEFTQASVRGQFFRADHTLARARTQLTAAREVWFSFQFYDGQPGLEEIALYLSAVEQAAGAVMALGGSVLSERRFLPEFFQYTQEAGQPGLYVGLLGLLGAPSIEAKHLSEWLPVWEQVYRAASQQEGASERLHVYRTRYYANAIQTLLNSERPFDALWPFLHTGVEAASSLPDAHKARQSWVRVLAQLGGSRDEFPERIQGLDRYLDLVDEQLERWAARQGI